MSAVRYCRPMDIASMRLIVIGVIVLLLALAVVFSVCLPAADPNTISGLTTRL